MTDNPDCVAKSEAEDARGAASNMDDTAGQSGGPSRWFGIGIGLLVASLFALYALRNPYPYIIFPLVGLGIFIAAARAKSGIHKPSVPTIKTNLWTLVPVSTVMICAFFGSVVIRRTYDVSWLPVVAGLLVGFALFLLNESARRSYLARSDKRNP